jgi:hypothetical protein
MSAAVPSSRSVIRLLTDGEPTSTDKDRKMPLHWILILGGTIWMVLSLILGRDSKWEYWVAAPGSLAFIVGLTLWVHPGLYYYFK